MKTHMALGVSLLLTLGTAVAGTFMYGHDRSEHALDAYPQAATSRPEVTPEMIAMWRATAASSDYMAPKAPI